MIIIAPRYVEVEGPLLFLGGPIRGAVDWQRKATRYIRRRKPELHIASPRRLISIEGDFPEEMYQEQFDWEHYYIKRAGKKGVMVFWLAKERYHKCDRAYAQTTRFEIGEASANHRLTGIKMVVGIEKGFSGGKYIRKTLAKKCPNVPLCDTLEETCEAAIKLATE